MPGLDHHGGPVDSGDAGKPGRMRRGVAFPGKYGMIVEAHENGPLTFGKN